jgi:hypothetical protein
MAAEIEQVYKRVLAILKLQATTFGILMPPYILMQIEDVEKAIKKDSDFTTMNYLLE